MIKRFLSVAILALMAGSIAAQTEAPPTLDEMAGEYIIMNKSLYEEEEYFKEVKSMTISVTESDSLLIKGLYWNSGYDVLAKYNPNNGVITIASGTKVFDWGDGQAGAEQYLYAWDDENETVIDRPIQYRYKGNGVWECANMIALLVDNGGAYQPYIFSSNSKIAQANGKTEDVALWRDDYDGESNVYSTEETTPVYITREGDIITIYNLYMTTNPNEGYGCFLELQYMPDYGRAIAAPTVVGQYSVLQGQGYKILAGCEYNEETWIPTGPSFSDQAEGLHGAIVADVDWENGIITLPPVAMWAAVATDTQIELNWDSYFEMKLDTKVTFDPAKVNSAISTPKVDDANKEVVRVEYYNLMGQLLPEPIPGTIVIKRSYFDDNTFMSEKVIVTE